MIFGKKEATQRTDFFEDLEDGLEKTSVAIIKSLFPNELRNEIRIAKTIPIYYQFPDRQQEWTLSETVNISRGGVCIVLQDNAIKGETIAIEIGRKTKDTREVFKVLGRIAGVSVGAKQQRLGHVAFFEKQPRFHQVSNVLWSLADINSWFLEKFTQDCQGIDVEDESQLKEAYRLVYQEYLAKKICLPNPEGMLFNAYNLVRGSRTFTIRKEDKLLGTICLIVDSQMGLPMESIFPDEIKALRSQGKKLAEVGALALNSKHINMRQYSFRNFKKQAYLYRLYKTMFDYARGSNAITDLVIGVHPRHEFLYKYLNFKTLSNTKSYHGANAAPAILMNLCIQELFRTTMLQKEGPGIFFLKNIKYDKIFNRSFFLSQSFIKDRIAEGSIWNTFTPLQQAHIKNEYRID